MDRVIIRTNKAVYGSTGTAIPSGTILSGKEIEAYGTKMVLISWASGEVVVRAGDCEVLRRGATEFDIL